MDYFLCVLGLVLIVEGLPYFVFPEKMKDVLSRIPQLPAANLRMFGVIAIMAGILLVFIAKRLMQ
jgi:uncharacterized protein YjeT (DUF2065 family)